MSLLPNLPRPAGEPTPSVRALRGWAIRTINTSFTPTRPGNIPETYNPLAEHVGRRYSQPPVP